MKDIKFVLPIALAMFAFSAMAQNRSSIDISLLKEIKAAQQEVDQELASIKSKGDVTSYLARAGRNSPLHVLTQPSRSKFLNSLVFTKHGLASYSYVELQSLSVTQAYEILSLFGAQQDISFIPKLQAANKNEESMLLISAVPSIRHDPVENYYCHVNGGDMPRNYCVSEYGSNCNRACL